jgi:hypothetical protein
LEWSAIHSRAHRGFLEPATARHAASSLIQKARSRVPGAGSKILAMMKMYR